MQSSVSADFPGFLHRVIKHPQPSHNRPCRVMVRRSWPLWWTSSFLFCLHDKLTESTWHSYLSRVCLGCESLLWCKSARNWRPVRRLKATWKDGGGLSATDHIHCSAASHCFSSRTWQPPLQTWIWHPQSEIWSYFFLQFVPGTACNVGLKHRTSANVSSCEADSN